MISVAQMIGTRVGRLVVLSQTGKYNSRRRPIWACVCDCGNLKEVSNEDLRREHTKSCGCLAREQQIRAYAKAVQVSATRRFRDLTGRSFGRLVVISKVDGHRNTTWLCRCSCGNTVLVQGGNLRSGNILSCGCSRGSNDHISKILKKRYYPHSSMEDIRDYLIMVRTTRKVEQCLTQMKSSQTNNTHA